MALTYAKPSLKTHLPQLPKPTEKHLVSNVVDGIRTAFPGDKFVLVDLRFDGPWDQGFVPDPKVDLRKQNAARRKAFTLDSAKSVFMKSLNKSLSGGEDYPILTGVLSILTGIISGGAGVLFTMGTTAIAASGPGAQPVLAREGDEIWHLERLGLEGSEVKHLEYFLLVDPYRARGGASSSAWIIHEERRDIEL